MGKGAHPVLAGANRAIEAVETALMVVSGFALFAMMLIIVVDVAARYLFKSPLPWSFDIISLYLMPAAFFLALSGTLHKEHHVNVDIVVNAVPPRVASTMKVIGAALALVVFLGITYAAVLRAWEAYATRAVTSGVIEWPTWVSPAFVVVGAGVLLLRGMFRAAAFTMAVFTGAGDVPGMRPSAPIEEEL